jgi:hypothetical protein
MKTYLYYFLVGLLLIGGCKSCNEDKINPVDPCSGHNSLSSNFRIFTYADTGRRTEKIDISTIQGAMNVCFEATDTTGDYYEWQVGSEPVRRTGKSICVNFNPTPASTEELKIMLKVFKTSDSCLKGLPQIDSTVKKINRLDLEASMGLYFHSYSGKSSDGRSVLITGMKITQPITDVVPEISSIPVGGLLALKVTFSDCTSSSYVMLVDASIFSWSNNHAAAKNCPYSVLGNGQVYLTNDGNRLVLKVKNGDLNSQSNPVKNLTIEAYRL